MVHQVGDKLAVWMGEALHTKGGLTRKDLMVNKRGKVVSKRKHMLGLKVGIHNLIPNRGKR